MLRNNIALYYTGYKIEKTTQLELRSVCELIHMYDKMLQPESYGRLRFGNILLQARGLF
jgi:hypothetical protein